MGSRAVVLVCRDLDAARARFGAPGDALGAVWTRTGRPFFDETLTARLVDRIRAAAEKAGLFDELGTGWLLLDAELLPWSAKAGQLLRDQYAAVGAAARSALPAAVSVLEQAAAAGLDVSGLLARTRSRTANADAFTAAYRRYCWPTDGLDGVRLAPFQLLASGGRRAPGASRTPGTSTWPTASSRADPEIFTRHPPAVRRHHRPGRRWRKRSAGGSELTGDGGEGMVVKPAANLTRGGKGLVQPGLKVRGREYLRIIYGPDYTEPANLERLRQRGLGHKRSLALREYALGLEALDRVARGEPLWRVHECVFAVLALESEPVDPRL